MSNEEIHQNLSSDDGNNECDLESESNRLDDHRKSGEFLRSDDIAACSNFSVHTETDHEHLQKRQAYECGRTEAQMSPNTDQVHSQTRRGNLGARCKDRPTINRYPRNGRATNSQLSLKPKPPLSHRLPLHSNNRSGPFKATYHHPLQEQQEYNYENLDFTMRQKPCLEPNYFELEDNRGQRDEPAASGHHELNYSEKVSSWLSRSSLNTNASRNQRREPIGSELDVQSQSTSHSKEIVRLAAKQSSAYYMRNKLDQQATQHRMLYSAEKMISPTSSHHSDGYIEMNGYKSASGSLATRGTFNKSNAELCISTDDTNMDTHRDQNQISPPFGGRAPESMPKSSGAAQRGSFQQSTANGVARFASGEVNLDLICNNAENFDHEVRGDQHILRNLTLGRMTAKNYCCSLLILLVVVFVSAIVGAGVYALVTCCSKC